MNCQTSRCRASHRGSESDARAVGWMVWRGETLGGQESEVVFCPIHAGRTEEAAEAQEVGFDARCYTCGEEASDTSDFDGTEEAAEEWMEEHICESDVSIIRPKVDAPA